MTTDTLVSPQPGAIISRIEGGSSGEERRFTGIAVFDGSQWASLCLEHDIASCGQTAEEALFNLQDAIKATLKVMEEDGLEMGEPVSEEAIKEFLSLHRGPRATLSLSFAA